MSVFSHVLLVFNSSTNIIIYSWKDKKFRTLLKKKLKIFNLQVGHTTSYVETIQRPSREEANADTRTGLNILPVEYNWKKVWVEHNIYEFINMDSSALIFKQNIDRRK